MRLYAHDVPDSDKNVSIHASVKDATGIVPEFKSKNSGFNPRICKRCDGYQRPWYEYVQFQSTHL